MANEATNPGDNLPTPAPAGPEIIQDSPGERPAPTPEQPAAEEPASDAAPVDHPIQKPASDMHHHPHHNHTAKGWKANLREFLMLFLAVFCGFLAEYQLEHRIDREREKKYIKSMVDDLRYDTTNYTQMIRDGRETMVLIDSLIRFLQLPNKQEHTSHAYHMARRVTHIIRPYDIFDRTYGQMKSSGNLRMLHDQETANRIAAYYADITLLQSQQGYIQGLLVRYIADVADVFDAGIFHRMYLQTGLTPMDTTDASTFKHLLQPLAGNPPLLPENAASVQKLTGTLHYLYARILSTNSNVRNQRRHATELLQHLQAAYKLH